MHVGCTCSVWLISAVFSRLSQLLTNPKIIRGAQVGVSSLTSLEAKTRHTVPGKSIVNRKSSAADKPRLTFAQLPTRPLDATDGAPSKRLIRSLLPMRLAGQSGSIKYKSDDSAGQESSRWAGTLLTLQSSTPPTVCALSRQAL